MRVKLDAIICHCIDIRRIAESGLPFYDPKRRCRDDLHAIPELTE
jgi:hypothetical protein